MNLLLAQAVRVFGFNIVHVALLLVLAISLVGIVLVVARVSKVSPPGWFIDMMWIVLAGAVAIGAILLLAGLAGWI